MKKMIPLLLALTFALSACTSPSGSASGAAEQENKQFTEYTNEYVAKVAENSYTTMHQFFENPQNYGIDPEKVEVTLGPIEPDEKTLALEEELSSKLDTFDRNDLNPVQQDIYDQLQYEFDLSKETNDEKYKYLDNIWSTMNGLPASLVSFFSEYELREESDIAPLIQLINDVPRYTQDALDYSKKQAEHGTLMLDYEAMIETCQTTLDSQSDSAVRSELHKDVEELGLTQERTDQYIAQIDETLDQSFFPSYQTMIDGLTALKDQIKPLSGLAALKNGKEYYELLVKDATGTDDSIDTIKSNVEDEISNVSTQVVTMMNDDPGTLADIMNLRTSFTNVEDILVFLNDHYTSQFPQLDSMVYDLQPLADEQSQEGVVAYFMIPAVDSTSKYRIRYNRRDYGDDPGDISLYQTLAHEGIPGHMYQAQYNKQHFQYTIQYFLSNSGFSEGYATYVENQSLKFLDLDPKTVNMYVYNDLLNNYYVLLMDIAVNYEGMSKEEFTAHFDMFDSSALEGIYDQLADNPGVFMSYYYGYYQISELRKEAKDKLEKDFDDVRFNDALLQSGSVNFDIVKRNIDTYIKED